MPPYPETLAQRHRSSSKQLADTIHLALATAVMASTTPTNPDTLVTLKVNVEGSNRRFKLPLRDLGASTLPDKVCSDSLCPWARLAA
jgi:hypothetical protein